MTILQYSRLSALLLLGCGLALFAPLPVWTNPAPRSDRSDRSASGNSGNGNSRGASTRNPKAAQGSRSQTVGTRGTSTSARPANRDTRPTPRPSPRSAQTRPNHVISRVPTTRKVVALTYDDGPFPQWTPRFLDVLKRKGVRGTFYVCGNMVASHPSIARRTVEEGHELGNHTWNHPSLNRISADAVRSQLNRTNQIIQQHNGGIPVATMRPPYGARNASVDEICRQLGLTVILWDVDTNDWRRRTAQQITETVLNQVRPGSIVLFHDRLQGSLDAQAPIIDGLRARGYEFVTVSELLAIGAAERAEAESPSRPALALQNEESRELQRKSVSPSPLSFPALAAY